MPAAFFFLTSPVLVRVTVFISWAPIQNWSTWSVTSTSQRSPARCLPTETCCQATQTIPFGPTLRLTQPSPSRSAARGGSAFAGAGAAGVGYCCPPAGRCSGLRGLVAPALVGRWVS